MDSFAWFCIIVVSGSPVTCCNVKLPLKQIYQFLNWKQSLCKDGLCKLWKRIYICTNFADVRKRYPMWPHIINQNTNCHCQIFRSVRDFSAMSMVSIQIAFHNSWNFILRISLIILKFALNVGFNVRIHLLIFRTNISFMWQG